ncbi:hypothetical protein GH714_007931 [Hevea brasiliensis]|uniref:Telomeric single stranded DNA binding POT1/Cdc13 domain-containing protein n=1 Tax=Hevea brasiliensis TaxID=3981 RepID=A0A6A6M9K9_HEVBR|nr:hypothetical protein GH714_007931 [Hevea brasiliensis]
MPIEGDLAAFERGLVLSTGIFAMTVSSHYVSTLKIVDESQQSPEFSVNIFTEKVQHLPVVKSHSDLVVLHNVMIKKHDGEVNAVFSKNFSSFALFDGKNSNDLSCYQALRSFSLSWREMNCIKNLRNWWPSARIDSGKSEYLVSVKDISSDTYFDLVCKRPMDSLCVGWSDAPLLSLDGKLKDEEKNPLPLQVESFALDQDTLSKFYRVGTILRVMADKSHENLGLQFHGVGKWVRIRNVGAKVLSGMWYGALNSFSRVRLLADDDIIVVECKRKFQERRLELGRLPLWSIDDDLTVTDYNEMDNIQFVSLMDILSYEKDDSIFCCVVRVMAIHPFQAEDLHSSAARGEHEMRLTLETQQQEFMPIY